MLKIGGELWSNLSGLLMLCENEGLTQNLSMLMCSLIGQIAFDLTIRLTIQDVGSAYFLKVDQPIITMHNYAVRCILLFAFRFFPPSPCLQPYQKINSFLDCNPIVEMKKLGKELKLECTEDPHLCP